MLETQKTRMVFCDGSLNPRSSSICFVVTDSINKWDKPKVIKTLFKEVKAEDTTEIEYLAVIFALEGHPLECEIFTDNQRVYQEVNKQILPLQRNIELYNKAMDLMNKSNSKIYKIPREKNIAGWILDKRLRKLHKKNFRKENIQQINNNSKITGYVRL